MLLLVPESLGQYKKTGKNHLYLMEKKQKKQTSLMAHPATREWLRNPSDLRDEEGRSASNWEVLEDRMVE